MEPRRPRRGANATRTSRPQIKVSRAMDLDADPPRDCLVREMYGLEGPFQFSERMLQLIWLRQAFSTDGLRCEDGTLLQIIDPGRWNRLAGPDFRDAEVRVDRSRVRGDIELHLHAEDWIHHGHGADPAYERVVLHVVLYPPARPTPVHTCSGAAVPLLVLLPRLERGIEEYANDLTLEALCGSPIDPAVAAGRQLPAEAWAAQLAAGARRRWDAKVKLAEQRRRILGWEAACHHAALEGLGYRFNRAPMLGVAGRFPLRCWNEEHLDLEAVFRSESGRWRNQGVRPANRPWVRLTQYAAWVRTAPDWPRRLRERGALTRSLPESEPGARRLMIEWGDALGMTAVPETRRQTLIGDGFLPLLTASDGCDRFELWRRSPAGDQPECVRRLSQELGRRLSGRLGTQELEQGLIDWLDAKSRERRCGSSDR